MPRGARKRNPRPFADRSAQPGDAARGDALARGDVRAIAPFIKAVEKLDRYQSLARQVAPKRRNMSDGDELVMQNLAARIRS
jgi:hypothetical protein